MNLIKFQTMNCKEVFPSSKTITSFVAKTISGDLSTELAKLQKNSKKNDTF